ncbi:Ig-like domain-containing protein [Phytohabitans flavus]|uniref:Ig-like domain-containing protein n=1 Tax=Phytohabitans flavus TaxID=1076124 RepID=UPI00363A6D94
MKSAYRIGEAPAGAVATQTALVTNPGSPQVQGTPVALSATVTPSTAAGIMRFMDGSTQIGADVTVNNGAATVVASALAVGTHQLTAVFTPTDATAFQPRPPPRGRT